MEADPAGSGGEGALTFYGPKDTASKGLFWPGVGWGGVGVGRVARKSLRSVCFSLSPAWFLFPQTQNMLPIPSSQQPTLNMEENCSWTMHVCQTLWYPTR